MSKTSVMKEMPLSNNEVGHTRHEITPFDLRLITKKIKLKFLVSKLNLIKILVFIFYYNFYNLDI